MDCTKYSKVPHMPKLQKEAFNQQQLVTFDDDIPVTQADFTQQDFSRSPTSLLAHQLDKPFPHLDYYVIKDIIVAATIKFSPVLLCHSH